MFPVIDDNDRNDVVNPVDYTHGTNINKREERPLEEYDEYLYRDEFIDDCED